MARLLIVLAIVMVVARGTTAQPAGAQEDNQNIAGYWVVRVSGGGPCLLYLEQDDADLDGGWACRATGNGPLQGTVSEGNAFNFTVVFQPIGNYRLIADGVLSEDGRHLQGSWTFDTELDDDPPLSGSFGETFRSGPRWSDMNCDRAVNSLDALFLLTGTQGKCIDTLTVVEVPAPNPYAIGADVNLDGYANSQDALLILQFAAGLIDRLPVL